jgi:hypothetical protein
MHVDAYVLCYIRRCTMLSLTHGSEPQLRRQTTRLTPSILALPLFDYHQRVDVFI